MSIPDTQPVEVLPLGPAQWALANVGHEAEAVVSVVVPWDGDLGDARRRVHEVLVEEDVLAVELARLPGVRVPVLEVHEGVRPGRVRVEAVSGGVHVEVRAPQLLLDHASVGLLAERVVGALADDARVPAELGWLDVLNWNNERVRRRGGHTGPGDRPAAVTGPGRRSEVALDDAGAALLELVARASAHLGARPEEVVATALSVIGVRQRVAGSTRQDVAMAVSGRPLTARDVVGCLDVHVRTGLDAHEQDALGLLKELRETLARSRDAMDTDPFEVVRRSMTDAEPPRYAVVVTTRPDVDGVSVRADGIDAGPAVALVELEVVAGRAVGVRLSSSAQEDRDWMGERLRTVLAVMADPVAFTHAVRTWPVVGPGEEQSTVLAGTGPLSDENLLVRVATHAAQNPRRAALDDRGSVTSYAELLARVGAVRAGLLRAGVAPQDVVGVETTSQARFLVAALGVLASGAAFLPLDPATPPLRRQAVLDTAGASRVVVDDDVARWSRDLEPADRVGARAAWVPVGPHDLCYVIATSGSTGSPSVVAVEHRNLGAYLSGACAVLKVTGYDRVATPAAPAGDLGYTALLLGLWAGATVVTCDYGAALDPHVFEQVMRSGVDVLKMTPTHLDVMLASTAYPRAVLPRRLLVLGGEASNERVLRAVAAVEDPPTVVNHYGPTETTIGVLVHRVDDRESGTPPLTRALPGTRARVETDGTPTPTGGVGLLVVGGAQVSRGLLGDPRRTAERFRPDPFGPPGSRCYHTGDLVRLGVTAPAHVPEYETRDGGQAGFALWFAGRLDDQVKIRGHRVELAEIAAAVSSHAEVAACEVVVRTSPTAGPSLVACVVLRAGSTATESAISPCARTLLPEAVLPEVVVVGALPRLPSGKVDRVQLLAEVESRPREVTAARTPLEQVLAVLWGEIIAVPQLDVASDIFAQGAHSLTVTQMASRLREYLAVEVPIEAFFEHPTVAALADHLERSHDDGTLSRRAELAVTVLVAP